MEETGESWSECMGRRGGEGVEEDILVIIWSVQVGL